MKIEVNITKRRFFFIILSVFVLAGAIFVYAYKNDFSGTVSSAQNFGHSADETVVNISGQLMTLQQAINAKAISGGGSGLETIVVFDRKCNRNVVPECPANYPNRIYNGSIEITKIANDGCDNWVYMTYSVCASVSRTRDTEIFSTPGSHTWTAPEGVTKVKVKVWGAGGGAGGSVSSDCGSDQGYSGAGGAYAEATLDVIPGKSYGVYVGNGGARNDQSVRFGCAGSGGNVGQDGESSYFYGGSSGTTVASIGTIILSFFGPRVGAEGGMGGPSGCIREGCQRAAVIGGDEGYGDFVSLGSSWSSRGRNPAGLGTISAGYGTGPDESRGGDGLVIIEW
jgi:hypothetical protein